MSDDDTDLTQKRDEVRKKFAKLTKQEKSVKKLAIEWAIDTYRLKDDHFDDAKVQKNGTEVWMFDEEMEADIAPFKANVSASQRKLPSTPLVQYAQMDSPLEKMKEGFHSRNYKYAAAFQYAHEQDWDGDTFEEEIMQKGGLTRLVKAYSEAHDNADAGKESKKEDDAEAEEDETDEEEKTTGKGKAKIKTVKAYLALPKGKLWSTKNKLPKEYVKKIVVARVHSKGFEILDRYPG